jgi:hypothetical protein
VTDTRILVPTLLVTASNQSSRNIERTMASGVRDSGQGTIACDDVLSHYRILTPQR